ncbi:MAG: hypothetical protein KAI45_08275 [Melioribacteraceae bacterium]|nr:hypothetical protein [Melioribacteraceae bacterium]
MQILLITEDSLLLSSISDLNITELGEIKLHERSYDPLEVISSVHSISPTLLILDDDILKPNSAKILKSIKQISKNVEIIFLTSDNSVDLGREISPIGIYFYGIKPISKDEILNLIKSVSTKNKSITFS